MSAASPASITAETRDQRLEALLTPIPGQRRGFGQRPLLLAAGEPAKEGQKLMQVVDLTRLAIRLKVHESVIHLVREGMPATVRVDAYPGRVLRGRVSSVATVASQTDWFSSDVKVYETLVTLDDKLPGLKPGMSGEATIAIGKEKADVLAVPGGAVIRPARPDQPCTCFVQTPDGPRRRDVVPGATAGNWVEVASGLKEGDEVIVNPQGLLKKRR